MGLMGIAPGPARLSRQRRRFPAKVDVPSQKGTFLKQAARIVKQPFFGVSQHLATESGTLCAFVFTASPGGRILRHAADPTATAFGARALPVDGAHGHNGYLVTGTGSLRAIAQIGTGQGATVAVPAP